MAFVKLKFTSLLVNPTTFYTLKNISLVFNLVFCVILILMKLIVAANVTLQVTQAQRALQNIAVCILRLIRIVVAKI